MRRLSNFTQIFVLCLVCCSPVFAQVDPDSSLVVTATVAPNPAELGQPVEIRAVVTNVGTHPASFGHDGCPVRYTIDGVFSPGWACAEFWRLITLQPGESFTFPESGQEPLVHSPHFFPLGPGKHTFGITVGSAGTTRASVLVAEPDSLRAYVSGQVLGSDAHTQANIQVSLHPLGGILTGTVIYVTTTGEAGYFFFDSIPPGDYTLSALAEGHQTWYPGTPDPAQAEVLSLFGYTEGLVIPLPGGPPPPPPPSHNGQFGGTVFGPGDDSTRVPLAGAWVAAIPVVQDVTDTVYVGDPGKTDPLPERFVTFTDKDGTFKLPVPGGMYKLLAGSFPGHDYSYGDNAQTWDTAQLMDPFWRRLYHFDLKPLAQGARSTFAGQVLGFDPFTDGLPQPLPGTLVRAFPLGPLPYEVLLQTQTDEHGQYGLDVFAGTPYFLFFHKDGYTSQFYGNAPYRAGARGVDARDGATTEHLDATLQPATGWGRGRISGTVMAHDICADGAVCIHPLVGALVRINPAYPTFAPDERTAVTDSNGFFFVPNLTSNAEGSLSYYVMAEARGYAGGYYPGGVPFPQAEPLPVFDFQTSDAGTIFLKPQGGGGLTIHGRVQNRDGSPVPNVHVLLFPEEPSFPSMDVRLAPTPISTYTDGRGAFRVEGLEHHAYLVGFSQEGYIPGYFHGNGLVHRWRLAQLVAPSFQPSRGLAVTLQPSWGKGPYIQAGRVTQSTGDITQDFLGTATMSPREIALSHHHHNLPHAFFYLVSSEAVGFGEFITAGGETGDNGTVVLTGLPGGVYYAYADRPGYHTKYFRSAAGADIPLFLSPTTPAILAEIALEPVWGYDDEPPGPLHHLASKPNPCSLESGTTLHFTLEMPQNVTIEIFDAQGRKINKVTEDLFFTGGAHAIPWNGLNGDGERVSAGMYFYRVTAGNHRQSNKIVVVP